MKRFPRATARSTARRVGLTALLALATVLTGPARTASAAGIASVRVTAGAASFTASDPVTVHVRIANDGDADLAVLSWNTPEQGLTAPLFSVTLNGRPAVYLGFVAKRPAPSDDDYLVIPPGTSLEYDVDLSRWYSFAESGDYDVTFSTASPELFSSPSGERSAGSLVSGTVRLRVEGRADPARKMAKVDRVVGMTSTSGCDSMQSTSIPTARNAASVYAGGAVNYFAANKSGQRYQQWFGAFNLTRWTTVKGHYANLQHLIDTQPMTFACNDPSCDSGTYAFVYPSDSTHTVYLCDAYWGSPTTGTDSRAGTIVHESSHFSDVAGTNDYAYGQSAALSLATSNPAQAIMNADSHEYFAEDTPPAADNAAAYTLDANSHDFGAQDVSTTSGAFTFTLTSSGTTALNLGMLSTSGDFAFSTNTCSGAALMPASTCTFSVTFGPTAIGMRMGSVTIPSNANVASSPTLTGTGTSSSPAPACGDGHLDMGEECDDGNVYADDGCSATCTLEPCTAAPRSGCLEVSGASLVVDEKNAGREKVKLQWKKIESSTTAANFGDPVGGSTWVALCLYTDNDALAHSFVVDRGSDTCDSVDCWAAKGAGFAYRDRLATSDGIAKVGFAPGDAFKGKASASAGNNPTKGLSTLPTGIASALAGNTHPTMQYVTSDGLCLTATTDFVVRDDGFTFSAKK